MKLIELLCVFSLITVLATLSLGGANKMMRSAKRFQNRMNVRSIYVDYIIDDRPWDADRALDVFGHGWWSARDTSDTR